MQKLVELFENPRPLRKPLNSIPTFWMVKIL